VKKHFWQVAWIFCSWVVGYFATVALGKGLSAIEAYSLITAWWLCAYVSSKLDISFVASVLGGGIYFVVFVIAALSGQDFFYRDIGGASIVGVLSVAVFQSIVFASPVLFNRLVSFGFVKIGKKTG
jgi:hypothetical protein